MTYQHITLPKKGEKIVLNSDHSLTFPDHPIIPFIKGDGIGIDISPVMKRVLDAAVQRAYGSKRSLVWMEIFAGEKANRVYKETIWLPQETLEAIREYKIAIKGPLTTPVGGGIRSINVTLRQDLDLYVCLRPVRYFPGTPSPLKHPEHTDMVIFRENSEDIYAGIEWPADSEDARKIIHFLQTEMKVKKLRFPEHCGIGIKPVSKQGSERLVTKALQYAIDNNRESVTLVHKGNIMKFTEGAFKDWGYEVARQKFAAVPFQGGPWLTFKNPHTHQDIIVKDVIADAFLQQILLRPREYSVIATLNLNGDYISDALAAQVGGIGIAPGANLSDTTALFEATHGTAPKYAGQNKVNPGSLILSGEMMLRYLGWHEAAALIIKGIERRQWLNTKAKQQEWHDFLKAYVPTSDLNLQCYSLQARLNTQQPKRTVLEDTVPLWLTGKTPPLACEAVFQAFEESELLKKPMVWQRIKLAFQEGNIALVRKMMKYVKHTERAFIELWIMVHHNPYLITEKKYFTQDHPASLEMLVHGVSEIAKQKPEIAKQIWGQISRRYPFAECHTGAVVRAIGLSFAKNKNPEAEKWLSKVPNVYASQAVHEWRVRIALGKEDWHSVHFWLKNFPDTLVKEETWQYWQARALHKTKQVQASQDILEKLAQSRSFYGFLASQHLQKPYAIAAQKFPLDTVFLLEVAKKESVQRARELHLLGRQAKAREEWLTATQFMSDRERHGAAALSLKWGLPNWSILALSKAENKNDLSLRFPIVHSHHIHRAAEENQIDPAYVFALTRQESAFVSNAKSSAGALGLMQLMPGTAKFLAKKHQIPLHNMNALYDPGTNINLGSRYIRMMLNTYQNHPILATAAYNAGPGRIRKWLPDYDMSADTWIETIPFKETREYVKNVMTYTVIYKELLGYQDHKTFKLPHIPGEKIKQADSKASIHPRG